MDNPVAHSLRRGDIGGIQRIVVDDHARRIAELGLVLRRIAQSIARIGGAPRRRIVAEVAALVLQLRAILDPGKSPSLLLHRLGDVADRGQGDQRMRIRRKGGTDACLERRGGGRAVAVRDVHEEPVAGRVVHIGLPVVARGRVASPAHQRIGNLLEVGPAANAEDVGAQCAAVEIQIDADGYGRRQCATGKGRPEHKQQGRLSHTFQPGSVGER